MSYSFPLRAPAEDPKKAETTEDTGIFNLIHRAQKLIGGLLSTNGHAHKPQGRHAAHNGDGVVHDVHVRVYTKSGDHFDSVRSMTDQEMMPSKDKGSSFGHVEELDHRGF